MKAMCRKAVVKVTGTENLVYGRQVFTPRENEETPAQWEERTVLENNARICQAAIADGLEGTGRDQCVATMSLSNAIYSFASRSVITKTMNMLSNGVNAITEEAAIEALRNRTQS